MERASIDAPMAQLARFSPAAVVQRITRGGDALAEPSHTIDEIVTEAARHRPTIDQGAGPSGSALGISGDRERRYSVCVK